MAMEIKIVNGDAHRVAEVREQEFSVTSASGAPVAANVTKSRLGPGESRSFWIHAAKTLLIVEDPNESAPKVE